MARCGSGYLNRRIADRGNDGGALDLFDHEVEQPQRLAWLTPGLGAVEWVERLQHLVPGLGLVSSSSGKETEPVKTVRDELTGNEEHPPNDDIIYDYPPVFDEYGDEEWYSWATGSSIIKDKVLYNRPEKIDEEDYVLVQKIQKKSVLVVQLCAAAGKQAPRVRSPLDHSDFWVCGSKLMEARSDRRDCRLDHSTSIFSYPKLLQFVFDPEKHMSLNNNDECKIVPFDPGGFRWAEAKLEDKFFQRRGE